MILPASAKEENGCFLFDVCYDKISQWSLQRTAEMG
jgi:hypothetical protein